MVHYELSENEIRLLVGHNGSINREMICRTGDYHARFSSSRCPANVTCQYCIVKLKEKRLLK
jgi:hypothetical protein